MKTPDEIKKGLYCCSHLCGCLEGCPYEADGSCENGDGVERDALAYIQQLEKEIELERSAKKGTLVLTSSGDFHWEIERMPGWISVKERLPDENGKYLVHAHHWLEGIEPIIKCSFWHSGKWDKCDAYIVDHWMHLPEPPAEV